MYPCDQSFVTSDFDGCGPHESCVAVAGWLADFFRKQGQGWEAVAYGSPFPHSRFACELGDAEKITDETSPLHSLTGVVSDFVSDQVQFDRLGLLPSFILVFAF
jgi:hypothetical protein